MKTRDGDRTVQAGLFVLDQGLEAGAQGVEGAVVKLVPRELRADLAHQAPNLRVCALYRMGIRGVGLRVGREESSFFGVEVRDQVGLEPMKARGEVAVLAERRGAEQIAGSDEARVFTDHVALTRRSIAHVLTPSRR